MKYIFLLVLLASSFCCYSNIPIELKEANLVILSNDTINAEPIGGMERFYQKWKSYAKYTKQARKNKIEGKIFVEFLVNAEGKISDFEIKQGLGYGLDEMTIKAIEKCGDWTPMRINGIPADVKMILPFTFRLK